MHRLVRLFGWSVLVAILLGVLWPERPDAPASQAVASVPDVGRTQAASRSPGPPALPPVGCEDCGPLSLLRGLPTVRLG